jgi:MFS superfamily sulfate permease-like transporter
MEGISTVIYHGKRIYMIDFSHCGHTKEDTVAMINAIAELFEKSPLHSVLAFIDVTHAYFHLDTLKTFSTLEKRCRQYEQKVAVVGLKGLKKTGFNKAVNKRQKGTVKAFDSEEEAKEWLAAE